WALFVVVVSFSLSIYAVNIQPLRYLLLAVMIAAVIGLLRIPTRPDTQRWAARGPLEHPLQAQADLSRGLRAAELVATQGAVVTVVLVDPALTVILRPQQFVGLQPQRHVREGLHLDEHFQIQILLGFLPVIEVVIGPRRIKAGLQAIGKISPAQILTKGQRPFVVGAKVEPAFLAGEAAGTRRWALFVVVVSFSLSIYAVNIQPLRYLLLAVMIAAVIG